MSSVRRHRFWPSWVPLTLSSTILVNGTNVVKLPATNAVSMIRGAVGTVVTLEIADPARSKTNKFAVKRGKVVIEDNRVVEITNP